MPDKRRRILEAIGLLVLHRNAMGWIMSYKGGGDVKRFWELSFFGEKNWK
jgi:hypothetical protein